MVPSASPQSVAGFSYSFLLTIYSGYMILLCVDNKVGLLSIKKEQQICFSLATAKLPDKRLLTLEKDMTNIFLGLFFNKNLEEACFYLPQ